jgi:GR25 family glycosyltransferase involved in LPS biosynthesis
MSLVALALLVFASDHHHPPVLVISEKGADARRQHMTALLGNAGIEFEFVDAFHVESGVVAEEDLHRTIGLGALVAAGVTRDAEHDPIGDSPGFKTDAELGCALSHAFALRLVSERQLSRALVLEDDVGFHTQVGLVGAGGEEEWQDAVGLVYDEFPEGHELVYLGWCLEHCERTELVSPHLWKPWRPLCTHSYIVTADGADKLLEDLLAVPRTLDHAFAGMVSSRKIAAYASSPALFMQLSDKFGSTNVARTVDVQKKLCLHEVAFNKGLQVMALGDMMEAHTQFTHAISFQPGATTLCFPLAFLSLLHFVSSYLPPSYTPPPSYPPPLYLIAQTSPQLYRTMASLWPCLQAARSSAGKTNQTRHLAGSMQR